MDFFEASLGRLHQLPFPLDLSSTFDGTAVVAAVHPAAHEPLIGWFDRYLGSPR